MHRNTVLLNKQGFFQLLRANNYKIPHFHRFYYFIKILGQTFQRGNRNQVANILNLIRTAYWVSESFATPEDVECLKGCFIIKHLLNSYIQHKKTSLSYCLKCSRSSQAQDPSQYLDMRAEDSEQMGGSPLPYMGLLIVVSSQREAKSQEYCNPLNLPKKEY